MPSSSSSSSLRRRAALLASMAAVLLVSAAAVAVLLVMLGWAIARPRVERIVARRARAEAQRLGLSLETDSVTVSPRLWIRVEGLAAERPGIGRGRFDWVELWVRPFGRGLRRLSRVDTGPGMVELSRGPLPGLQLVTPPSSWRIDLVGRHGVRIVGRDGKLEWRGAPVVEWGRLDGTLTRRPAVEADGLVYSKLDGRGLRLAALPWLEGLDATRRFGTPLDLQLDVSAVRPATRGLEIQRFRLVTGPVVAYGRGRFGAGPDGGFDVQLEIERLDLRALLAVAGLDSPAEDLGSLSASVAVSGSLAHPDDLVVRQRVDFTPPPEPLPEVERLRGPFSHRVVASDGSVREIAVDPSAPDYVALEDVPPLFIQALLLAEDAGFRGHHGIDLSAIAEAVVGSLGSGDAPRGASTITQQIVKNLLLSPERTLSRKLSEIPLALVLDSRLDKERLLEIYLNIVEWGPDLYGLRPAAAHYFGKGPDQLTPKEMAFLVRLIPGPVKYQSSLASGQPSPGFECLVAQLLEKLWLMGALTEIEYQEALETTLELRCCAPGPTQEDLGVVRELSPGLG
jgi:hypothetical protein